MRLAILSVLFAVASVAQDPVEVTRKSLERDQNKDGKPDVRIESVFRGKERVLVIWSKSDKSGVWTVTARAFYAGGAMVAGESDENGDGFFETLTTYRDGTEDMEVFARQRDGSVQPVSSEKLAAFKKKNIAISEFWDKASAKDADVDKILDSMRETQKTIQNAEREKGEIKHR